MIKKLMTIIGLALALAILAGCTNTGEQMICVPAKNISTICDQAGYDPYLSSISDVENQLDNLFNSETDTAIGEISGATDSLENIEAEITPDYTVMEGDILKISPEVVDPDGDKLEFTFTEPVNKNGEWQTKIGDAGVYYINITASDGTSEATKTAIILVKKLENRPPTLNSIKNMEAEEGDLVTITPKAEDPDGKAITLTISEPVGNDGEWQTDYSSAGEYVITVTASDDKYKVTKNITLTVKNKDRAPVISTLSSPTVNEGDIAKVAVEAVDADNDDLRIIYGAPLNVAGEWQTQKGDAGVYTVNVTVSDGEMSDTKQATITVNALNLAPAIENVSDITINENELAKVTPKVTDPENDPVTITISEPIGNDGEWQTDYTSAGAYDITITANDGKNTATKTIKLTVVDVNRPPVFG